MLRQVGGRAPLVGASLRPTRQSFRQKGGAIRLRAAEHRRFRPRGTPLRLLRRPPALMPRPALATLLKRPAPFEVAEGAGDADRSLRVSGPGRRRRSLAVEPLEAARADRPSWRSQPSSRPSLNSNSRRHRPASVDGLREELDEVARAGRRAEGAGGFPSARVRSGSVLICRDFSGCQVVTSGPGQGRQASSRWRSSAHHLRRRTGAPPRATSRPATLRASDQFAAVRPIHPAEGVAARLRRGSSQRGVVFTSTATSMNFACAMSSLPSPFSWPMAIPRGAQASTAVRPVG